MIWLQVLPTLGYRDLPSIRQASHNDMKTRCSGIERGNPLIAPAPQSEEPG